MQKANYKIIGSGSSGNALLFKDLLIDVGLPFKRINESINIQDIKYIFLTHEHQDHFKPHTIGKIIETKPSIRIVTPSYLKEELSKYVPKKRILEVEAGKTYRLGNMIFTVVELFHGDCPNVGYLINHGGTKMMYATDTCKVDHIDAKGYDYYFLECNHNKEWLEYQIELAHQNHEFTHFERSLVTHLNDEKFNEFIQNNAFADSVVIKLHQSKGGFKNN